MKSILDFVDWRLIFRLWSIQGFIAFLWLFFLPTSTKSEVLFGFSAERLVLLGCTILLTGGSIFLFFQEGISSPHNKWLNLNKRPLLWDLIYLTSLAVSLLAPAVILILYNMKGDVANPAYAMRLSPLAFWMMLSGLELSVFLAIKRPAGTLNIFSAIKPLFQKALIVLSILILPGVLIGVTGIGIMPDRSLGTPAVPFLEWQISLTLCLITLFSFFPRPLQAVDEKWIGWSIYVITMLLWLSQPVNPAYLATPPRAPNFEIYPFSDPLVYAQSAQSALVGNGFLWPEIPARPFYVALLTWFHLLGNQSYNNVIFLQTLVLGFFPVLLYLIGREFGGRPLGFGLALLTVFRDINANATVQFAGSVTSSKLFLSELPTALLICLVTLLSIRCMQRTKPPTWISLLSGGILGAATLVRSQSLILLPVIILIAFFVMPIRRQWLTSTASLLIGFVIVLTPWLIRNYFAAGGLILDNPFTQTMTLTRRWSGSEGNEILPRFPNEGDAEYSNRMMKMAIDIFKQNPSFILRNAANHFINSEISSLMVFPIRDKILSSDELLLPRHAFWKTPPTASQLPLFAFNLLIFSLGVGAAYRNHGLTGLFPLSFSLVYNIWSALFFTSGGRSIVPLDWAIYLYQLLGLLILGASILLFTNGAKKNASTWILESSSHRNVQELVPESRRSIFRVLILILCLGIFLPFTEAVFPEKYPPQSQEELAKNIGVMPENGEVVLYGRAIYPRYYEASDGEPETAKIGYEPSEKARLVFFLVGSKSGLVIFELDEAPEFFPHTSDVIMIGTQTADYFSARIVKVIKDSQSSLYKID
jgi:hypothetical protein